jgi:hypothetical protein
LEVIIGSKKVSFLLLPSKENGSCRKKNLIVRRAINRLLENQESSNSRGKKRNYFKNRQKIADEKKLPKTINSKQHFNNQERCL